MSEWTVLSEHEYEIVETWAGYKYRKRQPEKKQPTHEEIMTKWWKITTQGRWVRVVEYKESGMYRLSDDTWCVPEFLLDKESATIPPEAK